MSLWRKLLFTIEYCEIDYYLQVDDHITPKPGLYVEAQSNLPCKPGIQGTETLRSRKMVPQHVDFNIYLQFPDQTGLRTKDVTVFTA